MLAQTVEKIIVVKFGGQVMCYVTDCGETVMPGDNFSDKINKNFEKDSYIERYGNGHGYISDAMIKASLLEPEKEKRLLKRRKIN